MFRVGFKGLKGSQGFEGLEGLQALHCLKGFKGFRRVRDPGMRVIRGGAGFPWLMSLKAWRLHYRIGLGSFGFQPTTPATHLGISHNRQVPPLYP